MQENKVLQVVEPNQESKNKLSYEELEKTVQNLSAQRQNLVEKCKELLVRNQVLEESNYFKRLEWLWRIIDSSNNKFNIEFVQQCVDEFMEMMTINKEESTDNEK